MLNADCTSALQKQQTNNENLHGKIGISIYSLLISIIASIYTPEINSNIEYGYSRIVVATILLCLSQNPRAVRKENK